jgi:hypothetical protein
MNKLELTRQTGNGTYYTLTGMGIIIELIKDAMETCGADPADVFIKFQKSVDAFNVTFPTPHAIIFSHCQIKDGKFVFFIGKHNGWNKDGYYRELYLADPNFVQQLGKYLSEKARAHKATKKALQK